MNSSRNKWSDNNVYIPDGGEEYTGRPTEMLGAIPGSQIQCRCSAIPYFNQMIADIDAEADARLQAIKIE